MKKILLFIAVIALSTSVFAQDVKFGLKGGLNFANFSGDDAEGDVKTDIYIGGFARFSLTETLSLQPELVYSRQGSKDEEDGIEAKIKTNYLNIPILLRAKMFGSDNFSAIVGPQVGIHLNSEAEGSDGDTSGSEDIGEIMNGIDFALAFGFEYDITEKFAIGARYNLGLSKIIDDEYGDSDAKNSVFQVGVSLAF